MVAISLFTLLITIISMTVFRGFLRVIPLLLGILGGCTLAILLGRFSMDTIIEDPWVAMPPLYTPVWSIQAIIILIPAVTLIKVIFR